MKASGYKGRMRVVGEAYEGVVPIEYEARTQVAAMLLGQSLT